MSNERRNSFVVYSDSTDPTVEHLSMEQRGQLFTALLDYRAGRPVELDGLMRAVVAPFFATMDRDDAKFNAKVTANKVNGAKGGRPRKVEENPKNPTVILETQKTREGDGEGEGEGEESKEVKTNIVTFADAKPTRGEAQGQTLDPDWPYPRGRREGLNLLPMMWRQDPAANMILDDITGGMNAQAADWEGVVDELISRKRKQGATTWAYEDFRASLTRYAEGIESKANLER